MLLLLLLLLVMVATLTTCLSLVHHPPSILISVALVCIPLLLLALHSPLEAQGPPNTCPPSSLLRLYPHHKVSLIHNHRPSPFIQHHPSRKQRPTFWELSEPKMRQRKMMISSSITYYMPKAQLPIHPSITHLSNYLNHSHRLGMRKARG